MVKGLAGLLVVGLMMVGSRVESSSPVPDSDPTRSIGRALGQGSFPWYDAPRDAVRPIQAPRIRTRSASESAEALSRTSPDLSGAMDPGSWISLAGFALGFACLVGLLVWFWKVYEPSAETGAANASKAPGAPSRVEDLPASLRRGYDPSDPWAEAIRRRDRGDLAGAIICVFADQLILLARLGLLRLAPGKTARQLLQSVSDADSRGQVQPTLQLFEAACYGHRAPTSEEFEAFWAQALAFRSRAIPGAAR